MNARLALAAVGAVGVLALAGEARAACAGRPSDAGGFDGYVYPPAVEKTYAGTKVRVHYTTTGNHAPDQASTRGDGVPDVVAHTAESADTALAKYAELGFKAIPVDTACTSNGGDDKVDVYLVALTGADGRTIAESCTSSACSSFVLVASSFLGAGYPTIKEGFRTVVTHELFHAVQNAYEPSQEDRTWSEGTAQWGMKQVFPELVDFERQLPSFFKEPGRSIDSPPPGFATQYVYGSGVWPLFLSTKYGGPSVVRAVFEQMAAGKKTYDAIDAALKEKGASLADAYPLFGAWNVATKSLAGTGGYPDAAKYPGIPTTDLADGAKGITSGLSYYPYRGTIAASEISLDTDATRNAGVVVPVENGKPNLDKAQKLPANGEGDVIVVVAGTTTKKTDAAFTIKLGPPSASSSSGATSSGATSSGGGGGDSGGCALGGASSSGTSALASVAVVAMALAFSRRRRR